MLCLAMVLVCGVVLAETDIGTGAIVTQVVIWMRYGLLTVLGTAVTWAMRRYMHSWKDCVLIIR